MEEAGTGFVVIMVLGFTALAVLLALPARSFERVFLFGSRWRFEDGHKLRVSPLQLALSRFATVFLIGMGLWFYLWFVWDETPSGAWPARHFVVGLVIASIVAVLVVIATFLYRGDPKLFADTLRPVLAIMVVIALGITWWTMLDNRNGPAPLNGADSVQRAAVDSQVEGSLTAPNRTDVVNENELRVNWLDFEDCADLESLTVTETPTEVVVELRIGPSPAFAFLIANNDSRICEPTRSLVPSFVDERETIHYYAYVQLSEPVGDRTIRFAR